MRVPGPPLWLSRPTRFAGVSPRTAWWCCAALALLMLAALTALSAAGPPANTGAPEARTEEVADVVLYGGIVEGVRQGDDYYSVTADALRAGNYPLRPFVTFRLPTLAVVLAALPTMVGTALLYALVAAVAAAWYARLAGALPRMPPRIIALALLAGGLMAFVQAELVVFHEIWAGLLIALALALRRDDRWVEAVAVGLIAMLVRETAAAFVGVMALLALIEGRRRETAGWAAALSLFAIVVVAHAIAVDRVVDALDPESPGWAGMLGFGFFVKTMSISTALSLLPVWLAAVLVALALAGWAAWNDPAGLRVTATMAVYAVLIAMFARVDTFYWGLMIAPLLLTGLVFVPDAIRDLAAAALDRRRVRVHRISR